MTLAQIRTAIQTRGYATDTATAQTEMINAAYRRIIGMRRWPFLQRQSTISATAGDNEYDIDATITDFLHVDAVRLESGTEYIEPDYLAVQDFRLLEHADRDRGVPRYWTRVDDDLLLWPVPDKAYTITVDYHLDPADLSADGDTPVIPAAYHDLLVWGAIRQLCFRERDAEGRAMAQEEYGTLLIDMMNEFGVRQRQSSDEVKRSGYWDAYDYERRNQLWPTAS